MPTSSQALILQTSNGELPPLFQRKTWRPDLSFRHLPFPGEPNRRPGISMVRKEISNLSPLRRTGSEPNLRGKFDFSTLNQLLQIKRLGTSATFYNNLDLYNASMRPRELAPIRTNKYFETHLISRKNVCQKLFIPEFRNLVKKTQELQIIADDDETPKVYIKSKACADGLTFETSTSEDAEYFRLFEVDPTVNDSSSQVGTIFKLEKTSSAEIGSFKISPINRDSLNQFRLIPPSGCESDVYRLRTMNGSTNTFNLLQRDPYDNEMFRTVETTDWSDSNYSRWNNTAFQNDNESFLDTMNPQNGQLIQFSRGKTDPADRNVLLTKANTVCLSADNLARNVAELPPVVTLRENITIDMSKPESDSSCYTMDSAQPALGKSNRETRERPMLQGSKDQGIDGLPNQNIMGSIRNQSTDMYERLVNLGFRRAEQDPDKVLFYESIRERVDREHNPVFSSDWRTHNDDHRVRVTESLSTSDGVLSSFDSTNLFLSQMLPGGRSSLVKGTKPEEPNSAWKKKKIKGLRMRKEPPSKDPNAVCICLKDNVVSHEELKRKIEKQSGVKVVSLQFDPVSVQCPDQEVRSQWIIRFPNKVICEYLAKCGISLDGVYYSVKSYDDVMQREHNAYRYFTAFATAQIRKNKGAQSKRVKQMKTSENHTGILPQLKQVNVVV